MLAMTDDGTRFLCAWFAGCTRPAPWCAEHPVLGPVPICQECADRMGITELQPYDIDVIEDNDDETARAIEQHELALAARDDLP